MQYLHQTRCLLVLDNLESILQWGGGGYYRPGFEGYGQLIRTIGESTHKSCLIIISREPLFIFYFLAKLIFFQPRVSPSLAIFTIYQIIRSTILTPIRFRKNRDLFLSDSPPTPIHGRITKQDHSSCHFPKTVRNARKPKIAIAD